MSVVYHGHVRWKGSTGGRGSHLVESYVQMSNAATAPLLAFARAVGSHTECEEVAHTRTIVNAISSPEPGAGVNIDEKAVVYFRDPDDWLVYHFSYPAPIAADLEVYPSGTRMKNSAVVSIVGYISTLNEKTYIPLYGLYYQKV